MHVVLDPVKEPFVHDVGLFDEWLTSFLAELLVGHLHLVTDASQLICRVDVGHNTSIQHVLDVFQEGFINDVIIREDEYCL